MTTVSLKKPAPCDVIISNGAVNNIAELASPYISGKRALVVCGSHVAPLYGEEIARQLEAEMFVYEAGEKSKNLSTLEQLLDRMAGAGLTRDDILVNVGGGVTGDLGGLAAALYMRGIEYINVPTTLLAAVDSSVGGKTAVNITSGKNLAGVFHQPSLVICDPDTFATLPYRIYTEGMAEVIKYSFICGEILCDTKDMISRCIEIKKDLVDKDPYDRNERRLLNFGHTIGHAIEKISGFSYLHGEAVAIGMAMMTRNIPDYAVLEKMLIAYGLPVSTEIPAAEIADAAKADKKGEGDEINMVVPYAFGDLRVEKWKYEDICRLT